MTSPPISRRRGGWSSSTTAPCCSARATPARSAPSAAGRRSRRWWARSTSGPRGSPACSGSPSRRTQSQVLAYYTTDDDSRVVTMAWDGETLGESGGRRRGHPGRRGLPPGRRAHRRAGRPALRVHRRQRRPRLRPGPATRSRARSCATRSTASPAPGNPFDDAVYTWGHRNVQGLAFDDEGRLWASEFGQNTWDELNLIEAGDNYGWPEVEGTGGGDEFTDPEVVWSTSDASPSGLTFWDGSLWMTALAGETLWEIPVGADEGAARPDPAPASASTAGCATSSWPPTATAWWSPPPTPTAVATPPPTTTGCCRSGGRQPGVSTRARWRSPGSTTGELAGARDRAIAGARPARPPERRRWSSRRERSERRVETPGPPGYRNGMRIRCPTRMTSGSSMRGLAATICATVVRVNGRTSRTMLVSVSPLVTR